MRKDIVFGLRPVIEAVEAGKDIGKVFIKNGLRGELSATLLKMLNNNGIPFQFVPVEKLNRISRVSHQGVIAMMSAITFHELSGLLPSIFEEGEAPLVLVADTVTDVRNFGAMARSAECAGFHAILVPAKGGAMIGADAVKTSAGALHNIPVCRTGNLPEAIRFMKESGLKIVAASEKEDTPYFRAGLKGPAALIMGSEDTGITQAVLEMADIKVKIPVRGKIGSLNVSAAAAVLMYEFVREITSPEG